MYILILSVRLVLQLFIIPVTNYFFLNSKSANYIELMTDTESWDTILIHITIKYPLTKCWITQIELVNLLQIYT